MKQNEGGRKKLNSTRYLSRRTQIVTIIALSAILLAALVSPFAPVKTVKGLLVDTGLAVYFGPVSIDSQRVASMNGTSGLAKAVQIYDISSASSVTFAAPNGAGSSTQAKIYGNHVVAVGNITNILSPFTATISYCTLPNASPVQACGSWTLLANGLPQISSFSAYGPPAIYGDIVAWWTVNGLSYHHFSTGVTENITFASPLQPVSLSTNGEIIAFTLALNPAHPSYCGWLEYIDTLSGSDTPVNTNVYNCSAQFIPATSVTQHTIALNDNSTGQNRIRYFDYVRNQASTAGQGPLGNFTNQQATAIWGDRIVFTATEASLNFDCDGDGFIQASQLCLEYWNIRAPNYVVTTLAASAAPGLGSNAVSIYDKTIVFRGTNGNLQYVTVPMKGDVNLDGIVDGNDKTIVTGCTGKVLKGSTC